MDKTNGNAQAPGVVLDPAVTMTLTFDRQTFSLHIDFNGPNMDVAMAMLDQARRGIEQQLRVAGALQAQAQMQRAAQDAAIAAAVRGGKG